MFSHKIVEQFSRHDSGGEGCSHRYIIPRWAMYFVFAIYVIEPFAACPVLGSRHCTRAYTVLQQVTQVRTAVESKVQFDRRSVAPLPFPI